MPQSRPPANLREIQCANPQIRERTAHLFAAVRQLRASPVANSPGRLLAAGAIGKVVDSSLSLKIADGERSDVETPRFRARQTGC